MRYSILGFKQEELIKYDLDMSDVLLLDYIQKALSQPSMIKIFEDGQPYVWLNHDKILEDLPILNIKKRMLSNKLSKLTECRLIKSINRANDKGKGSKVYYTITENVEDMQYDKESTTSKKLHVVERPQVKNYTSNNKLNNNDNKLNNNNFTINSKVENQEIFLGSAKNNSKKPKDNLYTQCVNFINEYTTDKNLRSLLIDFFKYVNNVYKEKDRTLFYNQFISKIKKLDSLANNLDDKIQIVKDTLDNGWLNFYALTGTRKFVSGKFQDNISVDIRNHSTIDFQEVDKAF